MLRSGISTGTVLIITYEKETLQTLTKLRKQAIAASEKQFTLTFSQSIWIFPTTARSIDYFLVTQYTVPALYMKTNKLYKCRISSVSTISTVVQHTGLVQAC